jgi:short-subunit dehydrogenase
MKISEGERILVLGGSRGLGASLVELLKEQKCDVRSLSRKSSIAVDFSNVEMWSEILKILRESQPSRIIYCAAGGPYGYFGNFQWKDHFWSIKTTFEFPAFLLHSFLSQPLPILKQIIIIGSAVAESKADPGAAAYAAAKHAVKGLVTSLQMEPLSFDLRLLSPGYMNTALLPMESAPRKKGLAQEPLKIATLMIQSISDPALKLQNQSFD